MNLAPYSQFNNLGYDPPYVMFSSGSRHDDGGPKDSARNALVTGEFVCNMATWELREGVDCAAAIEEFERCNKHPEWKCSSCQA